jgi:transcriptional regulator with XRE-family HTH domain
MTPETINIAIGRQIGLRRRELRMSLLHVSEGCGVTLQQIHRYETGQAAVSAAMLAQLAHCLDVPVGYFFHPLGEPAPGRAARGATPRPSDPEQTEAR